MAGWAQVTGTLAAWQVKGRNGWGVGHLVVDDAGTRITIVGQVPGVKVGDSVVFTGKHVEHERFGSQFSVRTAQVRDPVSRDAIIWWLRALPDIGDSRAEKLTDRFGSAIWETIEQNPRALLEIPGITDQRLEALVAAYRASAAERDAALTLRTFGFRDGLLAKLGAYYGDLNQALLAVRENPYALQRDISGVGFKTADLIAGELGYVGAHPQRMAAALRWVLEEAASKGHCFANLAKCHERIASTCSVPVAAVVDALDDQNIAYHGMAVDEDDRVWLQYVLKTEKACADLVRSMLTDDAVDIERIWNDETTALDW